MYHKIIPHPGRWKNCEWKKRKGMWKKGRRNECVLTLFYIPAGGKNTSGRKKKGMWKKGGGMNVS